MCLDGPYRSAHIVSLRLEDPEIKEMAHQVYAKRQHAKDMGVGDYQVLRLDVDSVLDESQMRRLVVAVAEAALEACKPMSQYGREAQHEWSVLRGDVGGVDGRYVHIHPGNARQRLHMDTLGGSVSISAGVDGGPFMAHMYLAFVFLTDGYLLQIGGFENIGGTDMPHWEKRSLPLLNHSLDTFQKRVDAEAAEDPPFGTPLVRAGTVLFAPVQNFLHAGVSAGGHVCALTGLRERLVVLFTLVPPNPGGVSGS